ncbi:MAG: extracellular solute-binding protein [Candidatus Pacebacteria bacterium]|nr:extracellular solute-binding protein [Candidatus Paceibacterota bacterium]
MNSKFKIIFTSFFGFLILLGLIAFSSYKSSNTQSNEVEITVWGTVDGNLFDNYIGKLNQDKKLEIKIKYTQKDADTIDSELVEAIATGKAPDSVLFPQQFIKRYLDKVYLIDYNTISERAFRDTFVQEAEIYLQPEGIFAIPFFVDPLVMYWNKDLFASAGIALPPAKWSEFPLMVNKISKSDNNANIIKSFASLGEYKNIDNAKALISTLIMQAGSPIVTMSDSRFVSKMYEKSSNDIMVPAVSAMDFFTEYSNPKKSVYSWNRSLPSSKQSFLSEDLATYFGFASEAMDLVEKNPNLNFDVTMIPQVLDKKVTYGDIYGFSFIRTSPNLTAAFNTISLITGNQAISSLLEITNIAPARKDLISLGSSSSAKTVFYNSALISRGWVDPNTKRTDEIFQSMVENITTGRLKVDESVQKADIELKNLL